MDRLDCDRMFLAVFETGSFSRAAERLGTSSGQASKLISKLEADLGVQLLNRTTRAISPTEVGRAYYERIKDLIEEFEALDASVRSASGKASGRIALTVPISFGISQLSPALIAFAEAFAEVQLDISFSDRFVNLLDEGFDLAIRVGDPEDSSLIARKLCPARLVVAASSAYLARKGEPKHPMDLGEHECIIDTNRRDPLVWRFGGGEDPARVRVAGRLRLSNAEACLAAAEAGLGVVYCPTFMAGPRLRAGALKAILADYELTPRVVHALYPPSRHLALKVRALVDFLVERFRGEPPWDQGW